MILVLVCSIFTIYMIAPVSASSNVCCEKTKSNEYCLYTDPSNCDTNVRSDNAASTCSETSYCQVGCCQASDGTCFKSTSLAKCNAQEGTFTTGADCSNAECKKGCCVLSGSCSYVTDKRCEDLLKNFPELTKDFRDAGTETDCSNMCREGEEGCCQDENGCSFTSRGSCSGTFSNSLCSDIAKCSCTEHSTKGCYDDDVYWYDSCGNREDKVQDCDYSAGTICGKDTNGDFTCKSVNCQTTYKDEKNVHDPQMGGLRKNGESWCVYESGTGDYLDRPGTRHSKHMCVNGEEIVEPCRDYREEICIQGKVKEYTESQCIMNEIYDSEIESNVSTVQIGFNFWEDKGNCDEATETCKVVWVKKSRFASWKCEQNCECETQPYIDKMNKWCKSRGDCGANVNILGVKSESGFVVSGNSKIAPKKISDAAWKNYTTYGVFGGMKFLSEEFEKYANVAAKEASGLMGISGLSEALIAGAATAVGLTLAAAFIPGFAGVLTGTSFGAAGAGWFVSALPSLAGLSVTVIGLVVVVIVMIVVFIIFGGSQTKTYYVTTTCTAWQAPDGGKDCDKCRNDNKFKTLNFDDCTEYKCKSLGKLCEYILENEGTDRVACYNKNPNDVNSPVISPWPEALTQGYTLSSMDYGYSINPKVKPYTLISFGIKTNELSQCKISEAHTKTFDEMPEYFGENYFKTEHNMTLNLPLGGKEYNYYVRCKDPSGNANTREYTIKLSTDNLPDLTPPIIEGFDPEDGSYISSNMTQATVNVMLNEPSQCKWSTSDMDYDSMEELASCDLESRNETFILNYDCYAMFNVSKGDNTVYFRCADLKNNTNEESTPYTLIVSGPLAIVYSSPSGTLYDTASPLLEVTTAGGAYDGVAECRFSTTTDDYSKMIAFFKTNAANHKQNLLNLAKGDYIYHVSCLDKALNDVSTTVNFRIDADVSRPELVYIYSDGPTLHLILSKPSTCEYSNSTFTYGDGTKMGGEGTTDNTAPANVEKYHINCVDKYNNTMSEIIVYL
jgi:hypothetical protein